MSAILNELGKKGFGEADLFAEDTENALPFLHGASVRGRTALGNGVVSGCFPHEVLLEAKLLLDTAHPPLYLETECVI